MYSITPTELAQLQQTGPINLIDVRTPVEFAAVHAYGARNFPLDSLDLKVLRSQLEPGKPVYCICKSGTRAKQAIAQLRAAGIVDLIHVEGGTDAWLVAGLPVIRGNIKMISLERQVRIAAGLLVMIGAGTALAGYPLGLGLAGFVGAGLVFAGLTDTCGMAMLLARMPWNQSVKACAAMAQPS